MMGLFKKKNIFSISFLLFLLFPSTAFGDQIIIETDPMKSFTKVILSPSSKPYLLRAYLEEDKTEIELYIIHYYFGDHRFQTASVKWIDGTIKNPRLTIIDTDFDCSYSYSGCLITIHMKIDINQNSWDLLSDWAELNLDSSIDFQIQSNYSGEDFNFQLDAIDIKKFNDGIDDLDIS